MKSKKSKKQKMEMREEELKKIFEEKGIELIDLKFTDLFGSWQHFSVPVAEFLASYKKGFGFDGSSIRGFQEIHESDMLLMPDTSVMFSDVASPNTISFVSDILEPETLKPYTKDSRYVAKKAEEYLKKIGIADTAFFGPEVEFFIFDDLRFGQNEFSGFYHIDSEEGIWNSGRGSEKNLAFRPRLKEGYFPAPPVDSLQELRSRIVREIEKCGLNNFNVKIECHHHEVATAGQAEIDMKYDTLTRMADKVMLCKYIIKNIARNIGKVANFMPKPLFGDNGSGMHTHQSLWLKGKNIFFDKEGYAQISETAKHYIGGLLKHAPALCAFIAPTTNSYKRLVPGYEAPINLAYSKRNRSACVRIPMYHDAIADEKAKRIEFRPADPSCNPYLAFAAMLMAGIDGIKNKIDPGNPLDFNIYESKEKERVKSLPGALHQVLDALESDKEFLLQGDVFTEDLIKAYVEFKRKEIEAVNIRPHPYEFHMYSDI